ncbi:MAG TPA: 1-acyl-sn-glycerol-3-phosphate acyltransferase [Longimicrobiales bacterium]
MSWLSRFAARTFYRLELAGGSVPAAGPVLLVANHPNSLLDPALVAAAARRPVRFLAKAPLFSDPKIGWLVRGAGSIPVYRRADDPAAVGRNEEMFRAVHAALAAGAAVGIFPEGISHSASSLAPLKTGAARIALGAAPAVGGAFPVVPVGLCYRRKDRFRSEALALVGAPVRWDDLADAGTGEPAAVRELTRRIEAALHETTINLERWEDEPLVECAEAVYAAAFEAEDAPGRRVARRREAAEALARLRRAGDGAWTAVARDVARHGRMLAKLGLRPADLRRAPRWSRAVTWTLRQLAWFLLGAPLGAAGSVVFWPPYRLTSRVEQWASPDLDRRSTYKLLYGALLHLAWIGALSGAAARAGGWRAGLAAAIGLPALALLTVAVRDRWEDARADARRYLLLRGRNGVYERLRSRQREIADRLEALRREAAALAAGTDAPPAEAPALPSSRGAEP